MRQRSGALELAVSILRCLVFAAFVVIIICAGRGIARAREDGASFAIVAPHAAKPSLAV